MNKNQNAINILKMLTTDEFQRCTSSEFDDAIQTAIEALEKQESNKPLQDSLDGIHYFPTCPNCKQGLGEYEHHCECGQAIDWSDAE